MVIKKMYYKIEEFKNKVARKELYELKEKVSETQYFERIILIALILNNLILAIGYFIIE